MENKEKKLLGLLLKTTLENKAMLETIKDVLIEHTRFFQALPSDKNLPIQSEEELRSLFEKIYESRYKEFKSFLQFDLDDYLSKAQFFD